MKTNNHFSSNRVFRHLKTIKWSNLGQIGSKLHKTSKITSAVFDDDSKKNVSKNCSNEY